MPCITRLLKSSKTPSFDIIASNLRHLKFKQLNFVQHVKTLLKINGRAGIVVPDNVLFEGGTGETIRRKLLHECDVHTLLQGVKADVLFFGKKPASETPWPKKLWIYDLRTNKTLHAQDRSPQARRPRRIRKVLQPGESP